MANESNHSSPYGVFANKIVKSREVHVLRCLLFSRHTFFCILIAGRVNEEAIDQIMNAKRFNNTSTHITYSFHHSFCGSEQKKIFSKMEKNTKNGMSSRRRRHSSNSSRRNPSDDLKSCLFVLWHSQISSSVKVLNCRDTNIERSAYSILHSSADRRSICLIF